MSNKTTSSELDKLIKKLKKNKEAIEHFEEVEKETIIDAVEKNNTDFLTPQERKIIYTAYNKIKRGIQKTNELFPLFKKVIILIIALIIVYLIWKILNKLFKGSDLNSSYSVYVLDDNDFSDTLGVDLSKTFYDI